MILIILWKITTTTMNRKRGEKKLYFENRCCDHSTSEVHSGFEVSLAFKSATNRDLLNAHFVLCFISNTGFNFIRLRLTEWLTEALGFSVTTEFHCQFAMTAPLHLVQRQIYY